MSLLRLLIVDDDAHRGHRISSLLTSCCHAVASVSNLAEAAEAVAVQRFDAVLVGPLSETENLAGFATMLRKLEAGQPFALRAAILAYGEPASASAAVDGHLPDTFHPDELTDRIMQVSRERSSPDGPAAPDYPVFATSEFEEQCAHERELMVEIVDLFLAEREQQLPEMCEALADGDYTRLSRIAHTLKGSLGSLHANMARYRAQSLEMAAKEKDSLSCQEHLMALEQDLEALAPYLVEFRESCLCR